MELSKEVDVLPNGWIASNKELPKRDELCLIQTPNGYVSLSVFNTAHMCWDDSDGDDFAYGIDVIAFWQVAPEPIKN